MSSKVWDFMMDTSSICSRYIATYLEMGGSNDLRNLSNKNLGSTSILQMEWS